ncbi:unnamed protein product [Urochloa humidicola]
MTRRTPSSTPSPAVAAPSARAPTQHHIRLLLVLDHQPRLQPVHVRSPAAVVGVSRWVGRVKGFISTSDAGLIAEHHFWAGVETMAKNEAFSCSNGDVCMWKKLWPILAEHFGVEWVGYEGEVHGFELTKGMAGKYEVLWAEIVEANGLVATHVSKVANWWVVDTLADQYGLNSVIIDSMNKSKEHGFLGFRNSFKSFNTCIDRLKAHKIVP